MTSDKPVNLPPWASLDENCFERYGLLAVRHSDGSTSANLPIVGGLAGQTVLPEWETPCTPRFLLALSVVLRMMTHPDEISAPMAGFLTRRYRQLTPGSNLLEDGTRVSIHLTRIAKQFEKECIANPAFHTEGSLTVPFEVIRDKLAIIVRMFWADAPSHPSKSPPR